MNPKIHLSRTSINIGKWDLGQRVQHRPLCHDGSGGQFYHRVMWILHSRRLFQGMESNGRNVGNIVPL